MEEFLRDSPSDYNSNNPSNTTTTPNFNYNTNYSNPTNANSNANNANSNNSNYNANANANHNISQSNSAINFSSIPLNLDNVNSSGDALVSNSLGFPVGPGSDFLSTTTSYYSNNSFAGGNNNTNNNSNNININSGFLNDPSQLGSGSNSLTNEPFLDDIAGMLPTASFQPQLQLPIQQNQQNQQNYQPQFINPVNTSTNLDELISPQNNSNFLATDAFANSQYFSPPNRNGFNSLDAIPENAFQNQIGSTALSPNSRQGSIAVPAPDFQSGSYLSPQGNPPYLSPNYDFDTLRSPPLNSSYLGSPPQTTRLPSNANAFSTSIPINATVRADTLSPTPSSALSTSVPSGGVNHLSRDVSTKQLSKEEKMKRRREFHNAVERRRRDLIKEKIKELGLIVPPSLLNPPLSAVQTLQRNPSMNSNEINDLLSTIKVKETKPNKSTILNKSVDYIKHLNYVLSQQEIERARLEERISNLENEDSNLGDNYQTSSDPTGQASVPYIDQLGTVNTGTAGSDAFNPDDFFTDILGSSNVNSNDNDYLWSGN